MQENISPEERLLRLIRGQKRHDAAVDKKILTTVTDLKPTVKPLGPPLIQKYLTLFNLHKIILIIFIVSFFYMVISFVYPWFGPTKINLPKVTPETDHLPITEQKQDMLPYEFYLQEIRGRQIFKSVATLESEVPKKVVNVDLIKDITLVGIISGDPPQAIIEDKKTQKSYYLTEGQFIGELQVEDIREGKVILNYNGQRLELYL